MRIFFKKKRDKERAFRVQAVANWSNESKTQPPEIMKHHYLSLIILSAALLQAAQAYAVPTIDYALTTQNDPVKPGHVLEFDATVRNLSGSQQNVTLWFTVPEFTTYGHYPPGSSRPVSVSFLPPGASYTFRLLFNVAGGNTAPPDGTIINLTLTDQDRAMSVSRSVVVRRAPPLNLQLSTEQGTVAPGGTFTYTLTCANISTTARNGVTLRAFVPTGASFVSADGGGTLSGGVVNWTLGTLAVGANRQLHVTFRASATVNTSLGPVNATLSDNSSHIARASDTRAVYAAPQIQYIITAPTDPAQPGHVLEFDATVRNLSGSSQNVTLWFTVPEFTTYGTYPPGSSRPVSVSFLPPGASYTFQLHFDVAGGNIAPPDGTTIGLNLTDTDRAGSVSRGVVVRTVPPLNLQLSTQQGTVAPGGNFMYTLTCANISATARNGVTLRAPVPAGASFVSADGGGILSGGVVNWTLGTLTAGDDRQLHATFHSSPTANTPLGPVNATLSDNSGNVARGSDARAVYATPQIEYTITTPTARVEPGHVAEFDATVHNLSGSQQNVTLWFTVPEFTTYGTYPPGSSRPVSVSFLPPGASYNFQLLFNVAGGTMAPPEGTIMTLNLTDVARAGSVSRTIELGFLTPHITTDPATNLAAYSATLNGTVDPHGLPTTVHFEYGTTTSYGSTTASQTKTGNTSQNVSANISGLSASTTYHFRIVATNSAGTRYGADKAFTTLSPTGPPVVATTAATNVASFSATLNGSVYPHGLTTMVYFQYGTTTSYGFTTAPQSHTGSTYLNIGANISGLSASTTYHFRIVATNSAGTRYGGDRTFTTLSPTGAPVAFTNPATNVTSSSATLNGSLDPHGLTTSVYFQYGTTTGYGHTTPMQSQTGNTFRDISAHISSLAAHTTYHFRIVATNSAGTRYGVDRAFTTP
jgi:uncharacterized repeat protein (TIGR01451 family)